MQTPVSYIDIGLQVSSTAGDNKGLSDISNVSKNKVYNDKMFHDERGHSLIVEL